MASAETKLVQHPLRGINYHIEVAMGDPAQKEWLLFDTGHPDIVVKAGKEKGFEPKDSKTFKPLNCSGSGIIEVGKNDVCAKEHMCLADLCADAPFLLVDETSDKQEGIFGMAWKPGSAPTFVTSLTKEMEKPAIGLAMQEADLGSAVVFGELEEVLEHAQAETGCKVSDAASTGVDLWTKLSGAPLPRAEVAILVGANGIHEEKETMYFRRGVAACLLVALVCCSCISYTDMVRYFQGLPNEATFSAKAKVLVQSAVCLFIGCVIVVGIIFFLINRGACTGKDSCWTPANAIVDTGMPGLLALPRGLFGFQRSDFIDAWLGKRAAESCAWSLRGDLWCDCDVAKEAKTVSVAFGNFAAVFEPTKIFSSEYDKPDFDSKHAGDLSCFAGVWADDTTDDITLGDHFLHSVYAVLDTAHDSVHLFPRQEFSLPEGVLGAGYFADVYALCWIAAGFVACLISLVIVVGFAGIIVEHYCSAESQEGYKAAPE